MLDVGIVYHGQAFLEFVRCVEWQLKVAMLLIGLNQLRPLLLTTISVSLITRNLNEGGVVHEDLFTLINHLDQRVVIRLVEEINLLLLAWVNLVNHRLLFLLVCLFPFCAKQFFHELASLDFDVSRIGWSVFLGAVGMVTFLPYAPIFNICLCLLGQKQILESLLLELA